MNTAHSIVRAKERDLTYERAVRFTDLAIRNGKRPADLPCKERRYLERKAHDPSQCAVLYNGFIFILKDESLCITLYAAPGWFLKKSHYDGKTKIRQPKKYLRYACEPDAA